MTKKIRAPARDTEAPTNADASYLFGLGSSPGLGWPGFGWLGFGWLGPPGWPGWPGWFAICVLPSAARSILHRNNTLPGDLFLQFARSRLHEARGAKPT